MSGSAPRASWRRSARRRSSASSPSSRRATRSRSRSACCSRIATRATSGRSPSACAPRCPSVHVSASHEVLAQFREYERCSTTVIDAYLSPLLGRYLGRLADAAAGRGLPPPEVMHSSGGLAPLAEAARAGAWSVLSGPAGGAVGAGLLAGISGDGDALGLDMGGTSCDVCVVEGGRVRRTDSREIDGRPIQLPMVDVHTVGAGGGSIGWRDRGGALRVGPRSAGAEPGPACYGRGGSEPTVTDANLLLGYLDPRSALAGGVELDAEAAERAVGELAGALGLETLAAAEGIVRIANQEMVRALRVVTVERGIDPRRFALMPFGGAGPMHAAAIAAELGIEPDRLPARGRRALGARADRLRAPPRHGPHRDAARREADRASGSPPRSPRCARRSARASRTPGPRRSTSFATAGRRSSCRSPGRLTPDPPSSRRLRRRARGPLRLSRPRRRDRAGDDPARALSVAGPSPTPRAASGERLERGRRRARFADDWVEAEVLRGEPGGGLEARGPCVFELPETTLVLPAGWRARVDDAGTIVADGRAMSRDAHEPDPVTPAGADRRTALDLRRDGRGAGPRRPLGQHQGAPRLLDRALRRRRRAGHAGRAHPRPPRLDAGRRRRGPRRGPAAPGPLDPQRPLRRRHPPARHHADLPGRSPAESSLGFAASRAHHADVGGPTPGGDARRLDQPRGGGGRDRADARSATSALEELAARMRNPASASPTCAPSAPPTGSAASALAELAERPAGSATCARGWRRSSTTPSGAPARRSARSPTASTSAEDDPRGRSAGRNRRQPAGPGDDRGRARCGSTSPAATPRSRATSTARSR